MITKEQAQKIVESKLAGMCQIPGDSFVILENSTIQRPFGWVFFFDSKRYLETDNVNDAIAGNGPIFVNQTDGTVKVGGSAKSVEAQIKEYEAELSSRK